MRENPTVEGPRRADIKSTRFRRLRSFRLWLLVPARERWKAEHGLQTHYRFPIAWIRRVWRRLRKIYGWVVFIPAEPIAGPTLVFNRRRQPVKRWPFRAPSRIRSYIRARMLMVLTFVLVILIVLSVAAGM